ncbi:MAG: hypothetical protein VCD00_13960 [Candidatus Hydrogenedentota bacterium]
MDPKKLFFDERLRGMCIYCGCTPETRDHVPSKVLLDKPYPQNLPVVPCCARCNADFSLDEEYTACFIEYVITGANSAKEIERARIRETLLRNPNLDARIRAARQESDTGEIQWSPEVVRIRNVMRKLAAGHIYFEYGISMLPQDPIVEVFPIAQLDNPSEFFDTVDFPLWPEIGSHAFNQVVTGRGNSGTDNWYEIQAGNSAYLVSQVGGNSARIFLRDYLACEVRWLG